MKENSENSQKDLSRKQFLQALGLVSAGAAAGVIGKSALDLGKDQENTEGKDKSSKPFIENTLPIEDLPLVVKGGVYQMENQPVYEGDLGTGQIPFLRGGMLITSILIEKSLKGTLTGEELNKVTDAILALKGLDSLPNGEDNNPPDGELQTDSPFQKLITALEQKPIDKI